MYVAPAAAAVILAAQMPEPGRQAFEGRCASCHGSDGTGVGANPSIVNLPQSRELWERIVRRHFDGLPLKGLICTHFHYDHAGLSAWLTERFDAPLYMTHGEYFTMRTLAGPPPEPLPGSLLQFYLRAGMPQPRVEEMFAKLRRAATRHRRRRTQLDR